MYFLDYDLLIFASFCLFLLVILKVIPKIAPLCVFRSPQNFPYVIELGLYIPMMTDWPHIWFPGICY